MEAALPCYPPGLQFQVDIVCAGAVIVHQSPIRISVATLPSAPDPLVRGAPLSESGIPMQ
jgi:hypothetical protein